MRRYRCALLSCALAIGCGSKDTTKTESEPAIATKADEAEDAEKAQQPAPEPPVVRTGSPTDVRPDALQIDVAPLRKGDVRVERVKLSQRTVMDARDGKKHQYIDRVIEHEFESRLEVLESDADGPTKAKLVYVSRRDEEGGKKVARLAPRPAVNKPYLLSREGKKIRAVYEDETKPPAAEARAVVDANFTFAAGRFTGLLPTGSVEPGAEFELDATKIAALLESRPRRGQRVLSGKLTYRGLADEGAVFGIDVQLERLEGVLLSTIALRGELLFDPKTGRLVRATLQGPVEARSETGAHGGATIKGKGAIALDASVEWTRAG